MAPSIYVSADKATLLFWLRAATREIEAGTEGAISVPLYANPEDGTITFTDEDMAGRPDVIVIEVEG